MRKGMTDKVQKIREEVERLYNQSLADGNRQSDRGSERAANVSYGKSKACKEILSFIDSLQEEPNILPVFDEGYWERLGEEPVSEDLEEASKEWLRPQLDKSYANYGEVKMMELTHFDGYAMLDAIEFGAKWGRNQATAEIQAQSMAIAHGCPKESVCDDLGSYINELSKQFPEVSFAKLSRIAVRAAKWQKLKDMGITNNAKGLVTNILNSSDKSLDIYATEVAFIMLPANLTENYHMTNRDRISDAVRLGANWQKQQDQSIIELAEDHAYFAGRTKTIDEIKEALLSEVLPCFMHGGEADEVVAKLDEVLNQKK